MFGGLAFLVAGELCVGVVREELTVRVGPDAREAALRRRTRARWTSPGGR
jgi:hypothetical protein